VAVTGAEDSDSCSGTKICDATGACLKKDGESCAIGTECSSGFCGASGLCLALPQPRCVGLASACGSAQDGTCCASALVPGGTFYRTYDGVDFTDQGYPATVSGFTLDKYEVTVGRFRQFFEAGNGTQANPPAAGAGAHPNIASSGWDSAWNSKLPADTAALRQMLNCSEGAQTWTDAPGANENKPLNCVDWFAAFAFCAWDGGRLPTEAEWNYAASGGSEQRYYPWSSPATSTTIDSTYAVYGGGSTRAKFVGSKSPLGDGRWGHADLAGNVFEWMLDVYVDPYLSTCVDCARLTGANLNAGHAVRGGDFNHGTTYLRSANRNPGGGFNATMGLRCAR
jgi:formylglycine-generating enzyme required for sulfatase activity